MSVCRLPIKGLLDGQRSAALSRHASTGVRAQPLTFDGFA
jgi:hypothetical protein